MVDLDLLRAVVAVWRMGSVSAAALQLHMTQGAVSMRLKSVETLLGRSLFVRHARGVSPTEACEQLMRRVAPHLDAIELQWNQAQSRDSPSSTVYLGGPADFLSEIALPVLAPNHLLSLRFAHPDALLADLQRSELDVVVSTVKPPRGSFRAEVLFVEELVWVGHARDWSSGRWLTYAEGLPLINRYARATGRKPPSPSIVAPDLRALRAVMHQGTGTSVLPSYLAGATLPVLEELSQPVTNTLWLVVGEKRAGFASVQSVVESFKALAKNLTIRRAVPS